VFRTGPAGLGLLLGAQTVGAVTSSVVLVVRGDVQRKREALIASGGAYAAALALLGLVADPAIGLVLVALLGLTDGFWSTLRNTVIQLKTDDAYRGRTLSVVLLASRGGTQASHLETGLAVFAGGPAFAPVLGALIIAASILTLKVRGSDVRELHEASEPTALAQAARTEDNAVG
jgi:hypothetical protein